MAGSTQAHLVSVTLITVSETVIKVTEMSVFMLAISHMMCFPAKPIAKLTIPCLLNEEINVDHRDRVRAI